MSDWVPDARTSRAVQASVLHATGLIRQMLRSEPHEPVSLGQNCNSAWYLKQVGARLGAGPFDWIFSSADIADACLRDDFTTLLDTAQIVPRNSGGSAGHRVYHDHLFPHRNPIRSSEDYAYYVRAAQRLLQKLTSESPVVFVCTLILEPAKRPGWTQGFTSQFPLPAGQSHLSYAGFRKTAAARNSKLKYLFIEQFTEGVPAVAAECVDENAVVVRFTSHGTNTGVHYVNPFDDFVARSIMAAVSPQVGS